MPPGLRPAHRGHRADPARRLGRGPSRRAATPADRLWLRVSLGPALRAHPRGGRLRAATGCTSTRRPTASPGCGCSSTSSRGGSGSSWSPSWSSAGSAAGGWLPRFALVTGAVALLGPRRRQPRRLDRPAQPRPLRRRPATLDVELPPVTCPPTRSRCSPTGCRAEVAVCGLPRYWSPRTTTRAGLEPRSEPGGGRAWTDLRGRGRVDMRTPVARVLELPPVTRAPARLPVPVSPRRDRPGS